MFGQVQLLAELDFKGASLPHSSKVSALPQSHTSCNPKSLLDLLMCMDAELLAWAIIREWMSFSSAADK